MARPTTESSWASIRLGLSTWRRRTPPSPRPACSARLTSCRRWSTPRARCCSTPATSESGGEQRIDEAVANNVISAMQPIAGYSNGHNLAGGRPSGAKTGTTQLGDTGANKDAWMVGFTPSLATAVWVGTVRGDKPLENKWGSPVYGSGCRQTSGRRRWTVRWRAPTTSRSRSRRRSADTPACPPHRHRRRRRRRHPHRPRPHRVR